MISAYWLLLICPVCAMLGFLVAALAARPTEKPAETAGGKS